MASKYKPKPLREQLKMPTLYQFFKHPEQSPPPWFKNTFGYIHIVNSETFIRASQKTQPIWAQIREEL